jgi:hypothetical protein
VFVSAGEVTVGADHTVPSGTLAVLGDGDHVRLSARSERSELLLAAGRPLREPIVQYGPFVMNTREEIVQTMNEYRRTQFGGWPWQSDDPVHGREKRRFAKLIDGSVEEPA